MDLKIEHLCAYLPYNINLMLVNGKTHVSIKELDFYNMNVCFRMKNNTVTRFLSILRPLSDLKKDININGETINAFKESGFASYSVLRNCLRKQTDVDYKFIQKLFKYGFDVFELIRHGLAIDINKQQISCA